MNSPFQSRWVQRVTGIFSDLQIVGTGRWVGFSVLIGVVSGIGAILFDLLFRLTQWGLLERIGRFVPPGSGGEGGPGMSPQAPWLLPVVVVVGALISGFLVFRFAPEAEGHGTDAVIQAYHRGRGKIRRRVPLIKAASSAVTIGAGGSAGREGPIAQIGAGFGSFLADLLRLSNQDRRIMMMAGTAGGIGAVFRAPLGATLFSAEVLYSTADFEYEVLVPSLISSIVSYSVYCSYAGWGVMFHVPEIAFHRPSQLLLYTLLGLLCALLGMVYTTVFYGTRDHLFRPLSLPRWLKPAAGGLALGLIAMAFPEALGMGYGYIQQAIQGERTLAFLFAFALIKILATSLTISSGGSGGVFGPSIVIGGALGGAFGMAASTYLPSFAAEPAAFIMVGMGGFFAGVAKVPFASVIMVMEMTGSYGLLVPTLLVAAVAYLLLPQRVRLYENQVPRRLDSPVHLGSFAMDVLGSLRIGETWSPPPGAPRTVAESTTLQDLLSMASASSQEIYPVVGPHGRLVGEVSMEEVRRAVQSERSPAGLAARDLMREQPDPLALDDDLARAARVLAGRLVEEVTVVQDRWGREVVGTFGRHDLIVAYGRRMLELPHGGEGSREEEPGQPPK